MHALAKSTKTHMYRTFLATVATALSLCQIASPLASAAVTQNTTPKPNVSFTFDDGLASVRTLAAPTLKKYGLTGTSYVPTGCVGMVNVPNTCRADRDKPYMTWAQVQAVQNTFGWEIGSHTVNHYLLASSDASDGQPNPLTTAQVRSELTKSKSALVNHGLRVQSFATPYGDYNMKTLAEIAKVYSNHRGFADVGMNDWPYNEYLLYDIQITSVTTVASIKAQIDTAIAQNKWVVLTFHDIVPANRVGLRPAAPSPGRHTYSYDYSVDQLAQIASYVQQKKAAGLIQNLNPGSATVSGTSLLANGGFASGISGGWTTDAPTGVVADTAQHGSFPSPVNSIRFTSTGGGDKHLFSPNVPVTYGTKYALKAFLNEVKSTNGYIGMYMDEYDAVGNWISGHTMAEERSVFAENINTIYTPTSPSVKSARLQIYAGGNAVDGYMDNVQLIPLSTSPAPTNLMPNPQFDSGLSGGWTTDSASTIALDTGSHGSPAGATNSISLKSTAGKETHLFSPRVPVVAGKTYTLTSYLNVMANGGNTFDYYIDEYNASGTWVSGQYKTYYSAGAKDRTVSYSPSSANVATASLQVIVPPVAGAQAYFDWVRWYQN